jgi:hypothetical protein
VVAVAALCAHQLTIALQPVQFRTTSKANSIPLRNRGRNRALRAVGLGFGLVSAVTAAMPR